MKSAPPPPGWIERLYRAGVGVAIPLTIVAGTVLLLTARDGGSPPPAAQRRDTVVMAMPLDDPRRTVELRPPPPCRRAESDPRPCPPPAPR